MRSSGIDANPTAANVLHGARLTINVRPEALQDQSFYLRASSSTAQPPPYHFQGSAATAAPFQGTPPYYQHPNAFNSSSTGSASASVGGLQQLNVPTFFRGTPVAHPGGGSTPVVVGGADRVAQYWAHPLADGPDSSLGDRPPSAAAVTPFGLPGYGPGPAAFSAYAPQHRSPLHQHPYGNAAPTLPAIDRNLAPAVFFSPMHNQSTPLAARTGADSPPSPHAAAGFGGTAGRMAGRLHTSARLRAATTILGSMSAHRGEHWAAPPAATPTSAARKSNDINKYFRAFEVVVSPQRRPKEEPRTTAATAAHLSSRQLHYDADDRPVSIVGQYGRPDPAARSAATSVATVVAPPADAGTNWAPPTKRASSDDLLQLAAGVVAGATGEEPPAPQEGSSSTHRRSASRVVVDHSTQRPVATLLAGVSPHSVPLTWLADLASAQAHYLQLAATAEARLCMAHKTAPGDSISLTATALQALPPPPMLAPEAVAAEAILSAPPAFGLFASFERSGAVWELVATLQGSVQTLFFVEDLLAAAITPITSPDDSGGEAFALPLFVNLDNMALLLRAVCFRQLRTYEQQERARLQLPPVPEMEPDAFQEALTAAATAERVLAKLDGVFAAQPLLAWPFRALCAVADFHAAAMRHGFVPLMKALRAGGLLSSGAGIFAALAVSLASTDCLVVDDVTGTSLLQAAGGAFSPRAEREAQRHLRAGTTLAAFEALSDEERVADLNLRRMIAVEAGAAADAFGAFQERRIRDFVHHTDTLAQPHSGAHGGLHEQLRDIALDPANAACAPHAPSASTDTPKSGLGGGPGADAERLLSTVAAIDSLCSGRYSPPPTTPAAEARRHDVNEAQNARCSSIFMRHALSMVRAAQAVGLAQEMAAPQPAGGPPADEASSSPNAAATCNMLLVNISLPALQLLVDGANQQGPAAAGPNDRVHITRVLAPRSAVVAGPPAAMARADLLIGEYVATSGERVHVDHLPSAAPDYACHDGSAAEALLRLWSGQAWSSTGNADPHAEPDADDETFKALAAAYLRTHIDPTALGIAVLSPVDGSDLRMVGSATALHTHLAHAMTAPGQDLCQGLAAVRQLHARAARFAVHETVVAVAAALVDSGGKRASPHRNAPDGPIHSTMRVVRSPAHYYFPPEHFRRDVLIDFSGARLRVGAILAWTAAYDGGQVTGLATAHERLGVLGSSIAASGGSVARTELLVVAGATDVADSPASGPLRPPKRAQRDDIVQRTMAQIGTLNTVLRAVVPSEDPVDPRLLHPRTRRLRVSATSDSFLHMRLLQPVMHCPVPSEQSSPARGGDPLLPPWRCSGAVTVLDAKPCPDYRPASSGRCLVRGLLVRCTASPPPPRGRALQPQVPCLHTVEPFRYQDMLRLVRNLLLPPSRRPPLESSLNSSSMIFRADPSAPLRYAQHERLLYAPSLRNEADAWLLELLTHITELKLHVIGVATSVGADDTDEPSTSSSGSATGGGGSGGGAQDADRALSALGAYGTHYRLAAVGVVLTHGAVAVASGLRAATGLPFPPETLVLCPNVFALLELWDALALLRRVAVV